MGLVINITIFLIVAWFAGIWMAALFEIAWITITLLLGLVAMMGRAVY